jgi:PAS domain S-box-containing protein
VRGRGQEDFIESTVETNGNLPLLSPQKRQLKEAIAKAAKGQFVRYEVDVIGVWDTMATIDFSIKPVFDEQENVVLLICEGRDITQKKQAEEALQQSEERFRLLVDYSPVGIFQTDPQGDCLFVNPRWSEITGLSPEEAIDKGWVNAIYPEDRQQMVKAWYETAKAGNPFLREFRYQTPQGKVTWVFANATVMHNETGEIIGYLGTVTDISDRKEAEAALKESEARFRLLVDRSPVGIFQSDAQGDCTFVNPRWLEMTGQTLEESLGKGWLKPIHPDDRKQIYKQWRKAQKKGSEFSNEFRYETHEGKLGWAFGKAIALRDKTGNLTGYFGTVTDITARKQVEALLQQSHNVLELRVKQRTNQLAKINDSLKAEIAERKRAEEEILLLQSITKAIAEAPNFEEAIAVTLEKVCQTIGWNFAEAWIPDNQECALVPSPAWYGSTETLIPFREASLDQTFARYLGVPGRVWATKQPEWTQDVSTQPLDVFLRADIAKQVGLKSALGVPIVANEKVIAVFVFFTFEAHQEDKRMVDLVKSVAKQLGLFIERKRAEDALRSSMATNRALINAIPDWLFRISKDGIFVNFKSVKDTYLLFPDSEFLGKHIYEVFPAEVAQPTLNCIEKALTTGETQVLECQLPTDNGLRDYEVRIAISAEAEVMAIVRDITERKRREEDMSIALEKEKQLNELKSRFVAMTSHEFRTPLATILSSSELIEYYGHKWSEEKRQQYFQKIQASVKHMTNLLNDVLVLGKAEAGKLEFSPSAIAIASFCSELVEEVQLSTSTHTIVFQVELCAKAYLDEKLLRHILTNLLSNAIKYSPGRDRVDFDVICQSDTIVFRIRDYGIGVPESELEKLFDSFHRASNVGNISGTGLGLAIVKKSVDLHGGTIEISSQVGEGTIFTVTIPCSYDR